MDLLIPYISRRAALDRLLGSVPECIETVYIANGGPDDLSLPDDDYRVISSSGRLGEARRILFEHSDGEFVAICDSDNVLSDGFARLRSILRAAPEVGGVSGVLVEPPLDQVRCPAFDLEIDGARITKTIDRPKEVSVVGGDPFTTFDMIPNAAVFRRACLDEYAWDGEYVIGGEHLDFYTAHLETDWSFGICPAVSILHYPDYSGEYGTDYRTDADRRGRSLDHYKQKWAIDTIESDTDGWFTT